MENFYALLGVGHPLARSQALSALLGSFAHGSAGKVLSSDEASLGPSRSSKSVNFQASLFKDKLAPVRIALLNKVSAALQMTVSVHYQVIFSRYIRVVDMPKIEDLKSQLGLDANPNECAFKEKAAPTFYELMERKSRNPGGDMAQVQCLSTDTSYLSSSCC